MRKKQARRSNRTMSTHADPKHPPMAALRPFGPLPLIGAGAFLAAMSGCAQMPAPAPMAPHCAKPLMPAQAMRDSQQGTVRLAYLLGTDGAVKQVKVDESSGFPLLDAAAMEGLGRCTFNPVSRDGKPAEAWYKMQYVMSSK
ncbi:energy transducer TonB [Massilia glaciei]|uniref:Energy transducer TonB n=1 Tax=Massilia glaciei TaxID=1524097 RepID=A0A2U2I4J9_9BURK|nr:energy transducer TonB [Massilia glaciei]PWF54696.1 energy transducer TonB [Massilia glaciei]